MHSTPPAPLVTGTEYERLLSSLRLKSPWAVDLEPARSVPPEEVDGARLAARVRDSRRDHGPWRSVLEVIAAIQELLRYVTVSHSGRQRVATEDLVIGGQLIRAGEGVLVQTDSANRDETVFPEPDRLDIHRTPQRNLALGHGIHLCTGRALALIELEVVFPTLLRRIPTLRLAVPVEDIPFKRNDNVLGAYEMPVTW